MYQNYIFDFYGTLADIRTDEENPYLWRKMSEIYSAMGASYNGEELQCAFRRLEQEERERIGGEEAEPDLTEVFAMLYQRKGADCDRAQARLTAVTFRALSREFIRVYDGVKEFLGEASGQEPEAYRVACICCPMPRRISPGRRLGCWD